MEGLVADGMPGPGEPDPDLPAAEACPPRLVPASLPPCHALQGLSRQSRPRQLAWKEGRAAWEASGQGLMQLQPVNGCVSWGKMTSLSEPGFSQVSKMDGFYIWPPAETRFLGDLGCLV